MDSEGVSEGKPMEWGPKTHRGAKWRHPSVAGTDGQVVKGNGLPIQLHILPDTQHPLHRRDHKLAWVLPKGGGVSWEWPRAVESPGLSLLSPACLPQRGWGIAGRVLLCPLLPIHREPRLGWPGREQGGQRTARGAGAHGPAYSPMCLRGQAGFFPWAPCRAGTDPE